MLWLQSFSFIITGARAEVTAVDATGSTALHMAAVSQSLAVVQLLLERGFPKQVYDNAKRSPLYVAVDAASRGADLSVIKYFLASKMYSPNTQPSTGLPPLHVALARGNLELVQVLLDTEGCDVNLVDSRNGSCPLHVAVALGSVDAVRLLLAAGASSNIANSSGDSPLSIAIQEGKRDIVHLFSQRM